jgi:tetratricopeptide (TPR) repeat protein
LEEKMSTQTKKLNLLLKNAQSQINEKKWSGVVSLLLKAKPLDEGNHSIHFQLAWAYIELGQHDKALPFLARVEKLASKDAAVLNSVAMAYIKIQHWAHALLALLRAMDQDESYYDTYLNLATVYNNLGQHKKSLDVSMKAVGVDVSKMRGHLNMGVALLGMNFFDEARTAFETCLHLEPTSPVVILNLAITDGRQGNSAQAVAGYQRYLSLVETQVDDNVNAARYFLGHELLKSGQIKAGWDFYEFGFDPAVPSYVARGPARKFDAPRWNGQPIPTKRLLVWAEQGLGDEILFLSCLKDVLAVCHDVVLECEPRLVPVFARSFPSVTVRATAFDRQNFNKSIFNDFDYQISIGSLPRIFRPNLESFHKSLPFVIPDEGLRNRFKNRLAGFEDKLKIGICWRSGLLRAERNNDYSAIMDWGPLLQLSNCVFVNLQYGDCEAELVEVESLYGITILRWTDLNLKNDIDDVFALIDCLDLVVTAGTAVNPMTGALGKACLLLQSSWDWTNLGTDAYPWFPNTSCFTCEKGDSPATLIPNIANIISQLSN